MPVTSSARCITRMPKKSFGAVFFLNWFWEHRFFGFRWLPMVSWSGHQSEVGALLTGLDKERIGLRDKTHIFGFYADCIWFLRSLFQGSRHPAAAKPNRQKCVVFRVGFASFPSRDPWLAVRISSDRVLHGVWRNAFFFIQFLFQHHSFERYFLFAWKSIFWFVLGDLFCELDVWNGRFFQTLRGH